MYGGLVQFGDSWGVQVPIEGMISAGIFAAIAQSALIIGALLVWKFPKLKQPKTLGLIMAFGAGAVISAVAIDLVANSYDIAGAAPTAAGIAVGCMGYFFMIRFLEKRGASDHPEHPEEDAIDAGADGPPPASKKEARNLLVGMLIDGVPESVSIGLTLHTLGGAVSAALVGSVFIAGLPEAIGVAAAMLAGGILLRKILVQFAGVIIVATIAGVVGYVALSTSEVRLIAFIQSIAAGALLVVVVNEMVPIAVRGAKHWAGPLACAGFVFSAGLTWLSGG